MAERRDDHGKDVQAIEQILPERTLPHTGREIGMRGADDPRSEGALRRGADRQEAAFLDKAEQLGLQLGRQLGNLVEQQRSSARALHHPGRARDGAGEGAALMAEQRALSQLARDGGTVDGDEGMRAARGSRVQEARRDFLAHARLAGQHHGHVHPRGLAQRRLHRAHGG